MTAPAAALPPAPRALVPVLGALTVIGPFAVDMYLPALPQIGRDLGVGTGAAQLTLAVFLLGLAAGQAFIGPVLDRWGRRVPLLVGLAVFVLAAAGCALATTMTTLLGCRLLMALGAAATMVVPRAVVRDFFNEQESARMHSLLLLILSVSPLFAPSVGGQLMAWTGWRGIFWVLAGLGLACAVAVAGLLPEPARAAEPADGGLMAALRTYGRLLRDRRFLGPALVAGCTLGAIFCYLTASAFVLIELHGLSPQYYALLFGGIGAGLIAAAQVNRWLLGRYPVRSILRVTMTAALLVGVALAVVGATGWGGLPVLLGLLFLNLSAGGIISPNVIAIGMAPFGEVAGSASALLGTIQFGLGAGAGALVGILHNGTAVPMTAGIAACAAASWTVWATLVRPG